MIHLLMKFMSAARIAPDEMPHSAASCGVLSGAILYVPKIGCQAYID